MDLAAVTAATALLVWANRPPREALKAVDWPLLLFFAGLFMVVAGFLIMSHWVRHTSHPQFILMLLALTSTFAENLRLFGSVANVIVA